MEPMEFENGLWKEPNFLFCNLSLLESYPHIIFIISAYAKRLLPPSVHCLVIGHPLSPIEVGGNII